MHAVTGERLDDEFREFVFGCQARMLRFADLMVGDRGIAEDLAQHGFAKAYAVWRRIRKGDPERYVRTCIRNANTDRWRRGSWRETTLGSLEDRPDQAEAEATLVERDTVLRLLAILGRAERAVIVLRYYSDLSEAQISHELGLPAGTVKSTSARALRKLRTAIEADTAAALDRERGVT